jgi:spore coat protein CotH
MKSLKFVSLFLAVFSSFAIAQAASKKPKSDTEDLFAKSKVFDIKIEIPSASLASLKSDPRKYVKGVIREGDKVYADAGIRLKGSGSFQPLEKKPSLAIKFNEFVSGVRFHGHTKLFLNNSHQDPTYMCEAVGSEIFRGADVPAPRINYARVELNGRDLGLYVLAEAVNKDFLGKYFTRTKGNLYEGSNVDITDKLEKDSGDESKDQKDLKALAAAVKEADPATRLKNVSALLDVKRFISFAATEVFIVHHDGYTMDRNNYRIYSDPATNQMVFIPHGYDQLFGKTDAPLLPQWKGLVAKAILETPEGKAKYLERMNQLVGTAFKPDPITAKITELAAVIKPALGPEAAQAQPFDAAVAQLKSRIADRVKFVEAELKKQPK